MALRKTCNIHLTFSLFQAPLESSDEEGGRTLIVRKSVRVQDYSDPLMTIRDVPRPSPPPGVSGEAERPVTPPPGHPTIYQARAIFCWKMMLKITL